MKIGILYICTGKYNVFWKDFYSTCEKNFITNSEKEYFVFTDAESLEFEKENVNIHRIYQENIGWPNNTLLRYEMFLREKENLLKMDYLFFFNANVSFLEKISAKEFLPTEKERLVGALHFGYYNKPVKKYPYEDRKDSLAYTNKEKARYYFAGALNGGETKYFINTISEIDKNIKEDLRKKIVAKWHDESHWNSYLNKNLDVVKIINPSYLYHEGLPSEFVPKIILRDKNKFGGYAKLRDEIEIGLVFNDFKGRIIKKIKSLFNK